MRWPKSVGGGSSWTTGAPGRSPPRLGVRVIGTIGVLLRAKQEGVIPSLTPLLDALESGGFHLSEALRREAFRLALE